MSSIIVTENFKNLWKSGVQRQVSSFTEEYREYRFPSQASEQEPLPEELDDIITALSPTLGIVHSSAVGTVLIGHAATLGVPPSAMAPLFYLSGMNEVQFGETTTLLQMPDRCGLPLIYTGPFPVSTGNENFLRGRSPHQSWTGRLLFTSYDSMLLDVGRFTTPEMREECLSNGGQVAAPYLAANEGWCMNQTTSHMRYTGCFRLPTPLEIDTYFAGIADGAVLKFAPHNATDFFHALGLRPREVEAALYRERIPTPEALRPAAATNVPAQDFSGEPRRRTGPRPSSAARNATLGAAGRARGTPIFAPVPASAIFRTTGQIINDLETMPATNEFVVHDEPANVSRIWMSGSPPPTPASESAQNQL